MDEVEKILFVANQIPDWIERHKDKFNKLVYRSLKQQNRLYEVAMQKMLFGSLSKELQEQIRKEAAAQLQSQKSATETNVSATTKQGTLPPEAVLFADGVVPSWIKKYKKHLNVVVYQSVKAQGKLKEAAMQKMLFGSLPQEVQDQIEREVGEAKKKLQSAASTSTTSAPSSTPSAPVANKEVILLLRKISNQLEEILHLLRGE